MTPFSPLGHPPAPLDEDVPVLTDVVELEEPVLQAEPQVTSAASNSAFSLLPEDLHAQVMAELRLRVEPLVIERLREAIEPMVHQAMLRVVDQVNVEVARLLEDAVWRAVNEVVQQQAHRP